MGSDSWWCEAYGPPPPEVADGTMVWPRCFVGGEDPAQRRCDTPATCADVMAEQRRRVFTRIQEGAVGGDPVLRFLAEELPTPGMLLGGGTDPDDEQEQR